MRERNLVGSLTQQPVQRLLGLLVSVVGSTRRCSSLGFWERSALAAAAQQRIVRDEDGATSTTASPSSHPRRRPYDASLGKEGQGGMPNDATASLLRVDSPPRHQT